MKSYWPLLALLVTASCERWAALPSGSPSRVMVAAGTNSRGMPVFVRPADGARMVLMPAGSFTMGMDGEQLEMGPARSVTVSAFLMDESELSRERYDRLRPRGVRRWLQDLVANPKPTPDHPATSACWDEAAAYCEAVGGRLPTEAEWEYAARGPASNIFVWGNGWPPPKGGANLADEARTRKYGQRRVIPGYDDGEPDLAPVGALAGDSSWAGVSDLAGNAQEWTADAWVRPERADTARGVAPGTMKHVAADGAARGVFHVIRGGCFLASDRQAAMAASRLFASGGTPGEGGDGLTGFRCVMDIAPGVGPAGPATSPKP